MYGMDGSAGRPPGWPSRTGDEGQAGVESPARVGPPGRRPLHTAFVTLLNIFGILLNIFGYSFRTVAKSDGLLRAG